MNSLIFTWIFNIYNIIINMLSNLFKLFLNNSVMQMCMLNCQCGLVLSTFQYMGSVVQWLRMIPPMQTARFDTRSWQENKEM